MNLGLVSKSTHYSIQSHYTIPAVTEAYKLEEDRILAKYTGKEIVIAGVYLEENVPISPCKCDCFF